MPEEHHSEFDDLLHEKVAGIPAWGVGLGLGGLVLVIVWLRGRGTGSGLFGTAATPAPVAPSQTSTSDGDEDRSEETWFGNTPFGTTDIMGFPPEGIPKPATNTQWARVVADYLIASGDDPQLVTTALWRYLHRRRLSAAEQAVIDVALRSPFGEPPQGLIGPGQGSTAKGGGKPKPKPDKVPVPNVEGRQRDEAERRIRQADLEPEFDPEEGSGIVATQSPVPGRRVDRETVVTMHLASTGRANDATNRSTPSGQDHSTSITVVNNA